MSVHAYDQDETILGQGTLGLELAEQAPEIDTLLVAVGGGLIAGLAAWYAGCIKVIGVEPSAAPTLKKALAAGRPVDVKAGGVAADLHHAASVIASFPSPRSMCARYCSLPIERS
jgi:threonine dehydratase